MQEPHTSRRHSANRGPARARPRAQLLRDGRALLALAGHEQDLEGVDEEILEHLGLPLLLASFRRAVLIEARRSGEALALSGTLDVYAKIVSRLAAADRREDPYAEYRARIVRGDWTSRGAREEARTALVRYATGDVLRLTSLYLQLVLRSVPLKADRRIVLRAHRMLVRRRLAQTPPFLGETWLPAETWSALGRAVRFLREQETRQDRTVPGDRLAGSRKTGKRPVLTALHRHQARRRRSQPDYDWRDAFWSHARSDPHLDVATLACIAGLMISGCRPGEIVADRSVMVTALDEDGRPRLRCRIAGSKIFRPGDAHVAELPIVRPSDFDVSMEADRGQPWRILTHDCVAPEALWLHRYVIENGLGPVDSDPGPPVSLDIGRAAEASPDRWLHPSERRRRAVVALGKIVRRIGKSAFPTLDAAITPHVFRHAMATDLRASGRFEADEIARALGHLGIRSQSRYGTRGPGRPGPRAEALVKVEAPLQPRPRRDAPRHGHVQHPS